MDVDSFVLKKLSPFLKEVIITKGGNRKQIKNVKTIAGEEIARQHKIVVCDMEMKPLKSKKSNGK